MTMICDNIAFTLVWKFCAGSLVCGVVLGALSSSVIDLPQLCLCFYMAVSALCLFHSVPRVGQWYVFMVLPYHTHLLFVLVLLEYPDDYDM